MRLSNLFQEREDAYANADVRLCLECEFPEYVGRFLEKECCQCQSTDGTHLSCCPTPCVDIAAKRGLGDISDLTPMAIATEVSLFPSLSHSHYLILNIFLSQVFIIYFFFLLLAGHCRSGGLPEQYNHVRTGNR